MNTIHKYRIGSDCMIPLPEHKVLAFGQRRGLFHIWVELDPLAAKKPYRFMVLPTGGDVPRTAKQPGCQTLSSGIFTTWEKNDACED